MEWAVVIKRELSYSSVEVRASYLGKDVLICVLGGDKPHIGCTVQAIPRMSLTGDGTISATSSVINITGHKDEFLCRNLAEEICKELNTVVICTGGFHIDNIQNQQIEEVIIEVKRITKDIVKKLKSSNKI